MVQTEGEEEGEEVEEVEEEEEGEVEEENREEREEEREEEGVTEGVEKGAEDWHADNACRCERPDPRQEYPVPVPRKVRIRSSQLKTLHVNYSTLQDE